MKKIAIMRPLLPEQKFITPYLKEIDKNRWYSNFGPLVVGFEKRLEEFFSIGPGTVLTVGNGTSGLTATLRAFGLEKGTFCIIPSWTFMATAAAALASGLVPYFVDVDEKTWAIDPDKLKEIVKKIKGKVSSVIVVAPFGSPVNTKKWDDFTGETGIKVIIDGAAAFDSISTVEAAKPRKTPIMISMHATKVFGIGEGGVIVSSDANFINKVREMTNFGFTANRVINLPGTNGKMSEYQASVGHAALDLWAFKREVWMRLKLQYIKSLKNIKNPKVSSPWLSDEWVSSVTNIRLENQNADVIMKKLADYGIETKKWWIKGCHEHPAYKEFPKTELPVTEMLGKSVFGLPFSIDLSLEDIDYITESLKKVLSEI